MNPWTAAQLVVLCVSPAFLTAWTATALLRRFAPRWGLVDRPAVRKMHTDPTPLGGGVAIWLGVVVPLAVACGTAWLLTRDVVSGAWLDPTLKMHLGGVLDQSGRLWAILAAGTILTAMGLFDDARNLPWQPRLAVMVVIAFGLTTAGVRATVFVDAEWVGVVLSAGWILVLVNAFNFLDNMDGLSAGIGLIASVLFAVVMLWFTDVPRVLVGSTLLILAGALLGFLCHNRPPARIFMGDAGSLFVGLMLSTLTVLGTFYDEGSTSRHVILAPLCILAVPLYDFCSVMWIRLREGRSPFHADRSHFSHRLVDLGMSPSAAVLTIHLATLTTGLGALLLYLVHGWGGAAVVVGLVACVLAIVAILETAGRRP